MSEYNNIFPIQDRLLDKSIKQTHLKQRPKVLWLTGLSGSGKSTIAIELEEILFEKGFFPVVLDGDNIRTGLCNDLSFTEKDRVENIRRISETAKLFALNGIIVICSFISPKSAMRAMAKDIIGPEYFIEIFVNASLETCKTRDVKGLYAKANSDKIKDFTGLQSSYEMPKNANIELNTDNEKVEESVEKIMEYVLPQIKL